MSGLLDFMKTPQGQGLLAAVAGGLAGARRGTPLNNIGRAGLAGLSGYSGALDRQAQDGEMAFMQQQRQMQMDEMKRKQAEAAAQQAWRAGLPGVMKQMEPTYGAGEEGPTMTPGNPNAVNEYLMRPESPFLDDVLKQQLFPAKQDPFTLSEGQARYGADGKIIAKGPEKPVNYNELIIPDGKGGFMVNPLALDAKRQVAAAGRPSVTVNNKVENKASESVAKEIGPLLNTSLVAAEGATRVEDAANRVIKALDSGKVITGPLANARVTGLQIADVLGIGGASDQERLLETRKAIRGLSEMTLQGRKEMSGQGAITDRESALAEKATSGDINSLTAAEVRELAAASRRAAQYTRNKHKTRVKTARELPGMGTVADFFDIPDMPAEPAPAATPTMRFNPATGKLEQVR